MDAQTALHMSEWVDGHIAERDRDAAIDAMLAFVAEYPDLLAARTWTEIHSLAMREVTR